MIKWKKDKPTDDFALVLFRTKRRPGNIESGYCNNIIFELSDLKCWNC